MRKLCCFSLSASAAIFLTVFLLLPNRFLLPAGGVCILLCCLSHLLKPHHRLAAALIAAGLSFGFLYPAAFSHLVRSPAEALISGETEVLTFTVSSFPWETSTGAALEAVLPLQGAPDPKCILYLETLPLDLRPGDRATAAVSLRSSAAYRGERSDYYPSWGIYLIGYTDEVTGIEHPARVPVRFWPQMVSQTLKTSLASLFPDTVSGFLIALITGDKRALPTGLYAAFQRSGIAHVVAVSGLHVGFLSGLLTALLGKRSRISAIFGIALMFFFAAAVGAAPSVLRAAFMQTFFLIAPLVGREADKPTTLSAALLLILLPCPYAAVSVSLLLSFAAIAGIYLLTEPLYTRCMRRFSDRQSRLWCLLRPVLSYSIGCFASTCGALLFTTPLSAVCFRSVSLAGPLTNLFVLWAVSDAFLGGLISALLGLVAPGLAGVLACVVSLPAKWVCFAARTVAKLPFSALKLSGVCLTVWFLLACVIGLIWILFREKTSPVFPVSAVILTFCAALMTNSWSVLTGMLTVSVLDVGQGECVLFSSAGNTVLVDCGGNCADDPGDVAADAIQALGTSRLDVLVLTHCHADHAGGVPELLARVDVAHIILPDADWDNPLRQEILASAEESGCQTTVLSKDARIPFGHAEMQLYAPLEDGDANEAGLSVLCTAGDFRVLLTGDMNAATEQRLVREKSLPDIDLLVVGHHGSKNATSEELLRTVTPELAAVSSGWNSYGHPAPETLERLTAAQCEIYLTKDQGNVTFVYRGK